jgi:hypothetical protein
VQEALERGGHDHGALGHQRHGLAHLAVPVPEREGRAEKAGQAELVGQEVGAQGFRRRIAGTGDRLADGGQRGPGREVRRLHPAAGDLAEAALKLGGAPVLDHVGKALGHDPLGAGDGARQPGVVGDVAAEIAALVGHDQQVVLGQALGEGRHLLGGDAAHVGVEGPARLAREAQAELGDRPPKRRGEGRVLGVRAFQQRQPRPALLQRELRQRVGPHGKAGRGVQDVRPALGPAQGVVGDGDVEDHRACRLGQVRQRQKVGGRGLDHEEPRALGQKRLHRGQERGIGRDAGRCQLVVGAGEAARGADIGKAQLGPGEAQILGRGDQVRQDRRRHHLPFDHVDADRLGPSGGAGQQRRRGHRGGGKFAKHRSSIPLPSIREGGGRENTTMVEFPRPRPRAMMDLPRMAEDDPCAFVLAKPAPACWPPCC